MNLTQCYDFNDVLIKPGISDKPITRGDVNITTDGHVPVIVANMMSTGTYEMADMTAEEGLITFIHKEYSLEEHLNNLIGRNVSNIGITSGVRKKDIDKTLQIFDHYPNIPFINLDIANIGANIDGMINAIKVFKSKTNAKIVAGNIATPEIAILMEDAGADILKVGVGSGAACRTRSEIGVGIPQLTAISDVVEVVNIPIISDGGCVTSGDICKAIAAGAKYVMVGGMFSHCKELSEDGKNVHFYGLGSTTMYDKFTPSDNEYRPNEGRDLLVPVSTTVSSVCRQIKGALRSVCTYVGVDNINELSSKAQFVKVNNTINRSLEKYDRL